MNDTERQIYEWWVTQREKLERGMCENERLAAEQVERQKQGERTERERYERARQEQVCEQLNRQIAEAARRAEEEERRQVAAKQEQAERDRRRQAWEKQESEHQYRELLARKREDAEALARADAIYDSGARVLDEPNARIYQSNYAWAAEKRTQENQIRMAAAYCDRLLGPEVPFSEMEALQIDGLYDYILNRGDKQRRWREKHIHGNGNSLHSVAGEPQAGSGQSADSI